MRQQGNQGRLSTEYALWFSFPFWVACGTPRVTSEGRQKIANRLVITAPSLRSAHRPNGPGRAFRADDARVTSPSNSQLPFKGSISPQSPGVNLHLAEQSVGQTLHQTSESHTPRTQSFTHQPRPCRFLAILVKKDHSYKRLFWTRRTLLNPAVEFRWRTPGTRLLNAQPLRGRGQRKGHLPDSNKREVPDTR